MGSTYACSQLESHDLEVSLYIPGASKSRFAFLTLEDQEALWPCHPEKGQIHFHPKTKMLTFLRALRKPWQSENQHVFSGGVLRSGKLHWNTIDMPLPIAMSCVLRK